MPGVLFRDTAPNHARLDDLQAVSRGNDQCERRRIVPRALWSHSRRFKGKGRSHMPGPSMGRSSHPRARHIPPVSGGPSRRHVMPRAPGESIFIQSGIPQSRKAEIPASDMGAASRSPDIATPPRIGISPHPSGENTRTPFPFAELARRLFREWGPPRWAWHRGGGIRTILPRGRIPFRSGVTVRQKGHAGPDGSRRPMPNRQAVD
jgi:hypothetical protein